MSPLSIQQINGKVNDVFFFFWKKVLNLCEDVFLTGKAENLGEILKWEWGRRTFQQLPWNVIYGNAGFWLAGDAEWSSHRWMTWFLSVWPTLLDLWTCHVSDVSRWRDGPPQHWLHVKHIWLQSSVCAGRCRVAHLHQSQQKKAALSFIYFFFMALNAGETSIPAMPRKRFRNVQGI